MPITATAPRLAPAPAYLVFTKKTATATIVCGEQVDWVLTSLYDDQQVRQDKGGTFVVTSPAWEVVKYTPLHRNQMLHLHLSAQQTYEPRLSHDGRLWMQSEPVNGRELLGYMARHEGRFVRTLDDFIIRVCRGRILGLWKPMRADA